VDLKVKLVAGGKPQDVKCSVKPDSEVTVFPKPTNLASDGKILMDDLTAYIYNPAVIMHCEY
jgi:hypothetical protein